MVIPALVLLYLSPAAYDWMLRKKNQNVYFHYEKKVDSLLAMGWQTSGRDYSKINSFQDTAVHKRVSANSRRNMLNKLDFDEADSIVLQIVPGIGQTMAGRIVKFKENLGGLHSKEQLMDVYGMNPELLDRIFEYFSFSPGIHQKISINTLEVSDLAKHPYISYGAAKVIVAYREQHGPFDAPEDLLKIKIFNEEWLERLLPYLDF